MFGSDWPVCNIGGGGNAVAWQRWQDVVQLLLEKRGMGEKELRDIWGGVACKAYGIDEGS